MTGRRIELSLWTLSLVFATIGMLEVRDVAGMRTSAPSESLPAADGAVSLSTVGVDAAFAAHDPFRILRHPSPLPYRPELEGIAPAPPPPKPPNPVLTLAGVLGGPPWEALLEGVPDHATAVVVREGDRLGGLLIKAVTRDSVIIQSKDTTWHLVIKRGWQ